MSYDPNRDPNFAAEDEIAGFAGPWPRGPVRRLPPVTFRRAAPAPSAAPKATSQWATRMSAAKRALDAQKAAAAKNAAKSQWAARMVAAQKALAARKAAEALAAQKADAAKRAKFIAGAAFITAAAARNKAAAAKAEADAAAAAGTADAAAKATAAKLAADDAASKQAAADKAAAVASEQNVAAQQASEAAGGGGAAPSGGGGGGQAPPPQQQQQASDDEEPEQAAPAKQATSAPEQSDDDEDDDTIEGESLNRDPNWGAEAEIAGPQPMLHGKRKRRHKTVGGYPSYLPAWARNSDALKRIGELARTGHVAILQGTDSKGRLEIHGYKDAGTAAGIAARGWYKPVDSSVVGYALGYRLSHMSGDPSPPVAAAVNQAAADAKMKTQGIGGIGGAVAGFMVAGPVGAIIGGIAGFFAAPTVADAIKTNLA